MRLLSNRRLLGGVSLVGTWLAIGACTGTSVGVVDDDAGSEGGGVDAAAEASPDATVDGGSDVGTGNDGSTDGTMTMNEASVDANDGGAAETGMDASEGGSSDASGEAAVDAPAEAASDSSSEAAGDAANDGEGDASGDAPVEAAPCSFTGSWNMTVQTVTASPTLCQGVMDCTNCGILFTATSTQPTATTIDWSVDPGGTLCTAFSGSITAAGQFTTAETNCSPVGDGTTFDGQIDLSTCSLTATYVYTLPSCTITETMTGTQ